MHNPGHTSRDLNHCLAVCAEGCASALELGTMFGDRLAIVNVARKVGIDAHLPYLIQARQQHPTIEFIRATALDYLAHCNEAFDVAYCVDFLEHLPPEDVARCIAALKRVAQRICLFAPRGNHPQATDRTGMGADYWQTHRSIFYEHDLTRLGFDVATWHDYHDEPGKDRGAMFAMWEADRGGRPDLTGRKTITMTAHNRPHYTRQAVDSLLACNPESHGYTLWFGLEPGCDENILIAKYCAERCPTRIIINPLRLGVRENPFNLLSRVFDSGSAFNVYLEDDLAVSPDTLDLAEWFRLLPERENYHSLALFNDTAPGHPGELMIYCGGGFAPLGWACSWHQWTNRIKPHWHALADGWDWSIQAAIARNNDKILAPTIARATHIGRDGGTHCTPEFHDAHFSQHVIHRGGPVHYFLGQRHPPS